ncbi:CBS domain-containing protein [Actinomycetospora lemnae]|uniref:CBS domain-containing protein n=1 Tax=Actinomycetospora lemnae TaxID=3019891 RepID=A0ABT5T0Z2_9PSEU|nr:CBS domain-containing protein [Actinomycetospora sp. DW7H6]MDD7967892.1 CBS domain-containing protein [Actinomycetospora sp. DW7H6]
MTTPPVTTATSAASAPPEALDDDQPVGFLMGPLAPLEVPATTRVSTALHRLRALGTDHLVVRGHGPVRAVSEVDLLRHLLDGGARPARQLDTVGALATRVPTVAPTVRRSRAAELMLAEGHALLIVVADGEPCGVLDARTLLRSVAERFRRR